MSAAETVGIVGAGPFGTALAHVVAGAGRSVLVFSQTENVVREINSEHRNEERLPGVALADGVRATSNPAELAEQCRFIVLAVGAEDVRQRARELGENIDGAHLVVHAIGAYARPEDVPVSEVLGDELPTLRIGALAGPALPADLAAGRVASMVCGSRYAEVSAAARELLSSPPTLRIYGSRDLVGVELASSLSGLYTVVLGMADGLDVGAGTRAVLVTRLVAEASRLGQALGAESWTFAGLAGLGNLLVRGGGESSSREYLYGLALAQGSRPEGRPPVGARCVHSLARVAEQRGQRLPVLTALHQVLDGDVDPREAAKAIAETVGEHE